MAAFSDRSAAISQPNLGTTNQAYFLFTVASVYLSEESLTPNLFRTPQNKHDGAVGSA